MQHVVESHLPTSHTVLPEFLEYPSSQVKPAQVGGGVVVTVMMMTVQHVEESHLPTWQAVLASFAEVPSGQVKLAQVGGGVVVTVVQGGASSLQQTALLQ